MMPLREPIIIESAESGEVPPLHWRGFRNPVLADLSAFGIMVFGPPEWALHVYLGRWLIGIERTCEED